MYNRGGFNWTWIFLLFFGFSIVGMISAALVEFLAFPIGWSGLISLVLLGTAAFLLFQGYGGQMWLLTACVILTVLVGLAFLRSLTITKPDSIPEGIPEDILEDDNFTFSRGDYEFEADNDEFAVFFTPTTTAPVLVEFSAIETPGGVWAFREGRIEMTDPVLYGDTADNTVAFDDDDLLARADEQVRLTQPYLEVSLPFGQRFRERLLRLSASLTVAYVDGRGEITEQTLARSFTVYVAGENFFVYQQEFQDYQRARSFVTNPFEAAGLGIVGALALVGAVIVYRQGEWRNRSIGSGLQVVIRSQSGVQRLGVEAFDPAAINDVETPPDGGVFIGRVEAQSPAGRGGLMTNDIMLSFDGKPVKTPRELSRLASKAERGQSVTVTVIRHGEQQELTIKF